MSNTAQPQDKTEPSQQPQQQKPPVLEEDDEFEDFPVEGEQTVTGTALIIHLNHLDYPPSPQISRDDLARTRRLGSIALT